MKTLLRVTGTSIALFILSAVSIEGQGMRGSPAKMQRQHSVAQEHGFTFIRTSEQVRRFVQQGYLVHLPGNENYTLARVSHPYVRPEVRLFIERLSAQYRSACGERLVVTSATRPLNAQPANASARSVHPTGMAIDLRVSQQPRCRSWLERTLLSLERQGVLSANRERRPPHYHVAVFPRQYASYVSRLGGRPALARAEEAMRYQVRRGDSLWGIARRHGLDVATLKEVNRLTSSRIYAGQTLEIPVGVR